MSDVFGERAAEGGGGGGSAPPGPSLGPVRWRQEVSVRGAKAAGRSVVVEQVGEVIRTGYCDGNFC